MVDDCTYNDLPLYGGERQNAEHQPLAARGLTFVPISARRCVSRVGAFTAHAMRNGCAWNHSASRPGLTTCCIIWARWDIAWGWRARCTKPQAVYPFQPVEGFNPNCVRNPTRAHEAGVTKLWAKARNLFV